MTQIIGHWAKMLERLEAGQPLRLIIGEKLYDAGEIVLSERFQAELRRSLVGELRARIADPVLDSDPHDLAAPALPGTEPG